MSADDQQEFFSVGWVSDAHGIKGESYIRLYTLSPDWLEQLSQFRLLKVTQDCKDRLKKKKQKNEILSEDIKEQKILKVNFKKPHKQGLRVKLEGVNDRNHSESLKGWIVQIPKAYLSTEKEDEFFFHEIMGFRLFDQYKKVCGEVESHYNNGAHDILVLKNDFSSKEVPFVQDWIVKINFKDKEIFMNLPEGLFEL